MNRYLALKQERHELTAEANGLDLGTDEGKARFAEIEARVQQVDADLLVEERRRELERMAPAVQPSRISQVRDLAAERPWGTDTGYPLGEFLAAVARAPQGMGTDPRLLYQAAAQGAGEAVGSDGGFLLPKTTNDDILLQVYAGEVLSRVKRRTMTVGNSIDINVIDETSRATGSRHGGVQGYWVAEGVAATGSRPKTSQLSFKVKKVMALGYATDELLADAALMQSLMFDAFVDELKFLTEDAVIEGTGAGQPQGILKSPCLITVAKETGQAAATLVKENVDKMWARLFARHRANAVWYINQDIEPELDNLSMVIGTGGVPVYLPPGGLADTPWARLKGRPVIPIEYCSTLGTVGDIIVGDPSAYWLFDKGEPQQGSSIHVAFLTDETAFRVTYRVDGQSRYKSAVTPFKGSNTLSPFVALATRA